MLITNPQNVLPGRTLFGSYGNLKITRQPAMLATRSKRRDDGTETSYGN